MTATPCIVKKAWNGHRIGAIVAIQSELALKLDAKGVVEIIGKKPLEDSTKIITKPMKQSRI